MPSTPKKIDFFISYNKADKAWAEWIAWELEDVGYTTFLQAWDFRPGMNFVAQMQKGTADCEQTIAVLSQTYLSAKFTHPEWQAAFAQDPTGEKGVLIPIRVEECDVEGILPQIIFIDLLGSDETANRDRLIQGVSKKRAKPVVKPSFPGRLRPDKDGTRTAGTSRSISNITIPRNPNFTGRDELLTTLRDNLTSGDPTEQIQVIIGMGGVGKTQTALEYVYRYGTDYQIVWWVRADQPATLAADYAALAVPLDLPISGAQDQRTIIVAVRERLAAMGDWLLVFDDVPSPQDVMAYLPSGSAGHVIITSRYQGWRGVAQPVVIEVMAPSEGQEFLQKRSGRVEPQAAESLAEVLGYLPLAMEQTGAYVEESGISLAAYLELYQTRRKELDNHERAPAGYKHTVASTWSMILEHLQEKIPAAVDLLSLFAYLGPNDIPEDLLVQLKDKLPEALQQAVSDPLKLNDAIAALRNYSLITTSDGTFAVHRLVQAVVRDRLAAEGMAEAWAAVGVELVNAAFPYDSDDVRTWPKCSRLLEHGLAVSRHAESLGVALDTTSMLLNQMGLYLKSRAEFIDARQILQRALAIDLQNLGQNHPKVAVVHNNIGLVLLDLGDLQGALKNFEQAQTIDLNIYGPNHPSVGIDYNNMGLVLKQTGDLMEARKQFENALQIAEINYGKDHSLIATHLNNLSFVMKELGDLRGARRNYERALEIDEQIYGPDHPAVAGDLNNLGNVLKDLGDLSGTRKNLKRALKIFRGSLGDEHPDTVTVRRNLENL